MKVLLANKLNDFCFDTTWLFCFQVLWNSLEFLLVFIIFADRRVVVDFEIPSWLLLHTELGTTFFQFIFVLRKKLDDAETGFLVIVLFVAFQSKVFRRCKIFFGFKYIFFSFAFASFASFASFEKKNDSYFLTFYKHVTSMLPLSYFFYMRQWY